MDGSTRLVLKDVEDTSGKVVEESGYMILWRGVSVQAPLENKAFGYVADGLLHGLLPPYTRVYLMGFRVLKLIPNDFAPASIDP